MKRKTISECVVGDECTSLHDAGDASEQTINTHSLSCKAQTNKIRWGQEFGAWQGYERAQAGETVLRARRSESSELRSPGSAWC